MTKVQWQIAEEAQLLAEEKWIIQALNLVKKERNCLQIERLQLESLKMQQSQGARIPNISNAESAQPSTSVIELMKNYKGSNSGDRIMFEDNATNACNEEELNLNTTNSVFGHMSGIDNGEMEEEDEALDVIIDMNMLMDSECDKNDENYILG